VALISVVEAGFIVSGNIGTGIVLRKKQDNEMGWSAPSACGLTGAGWGVTAGAAIKDLLIFIMEENVLHGLALNGMSTDHGLKLSRQEEVTIGPLGRTFSADDSTGGFGSTIAVAFKKGAFVGMSFQGAVIDIDDKANRNFYGKEVSAFEILYGKDINVPANMATLDDVYKKLGELASCSNHDFQEVTDIEEKKAIEPQEEVFNKGADPLDGSEY